MEERESTSLGKYRLLAELGRGGMAKVFLALVKGPAGFNKLVVIKQIQAQLAEDPEFVTMFLDEARLAARLNHPNVVQTNEVGQDGHRYFIAMESLEGQTLNRIHNKVGKELSLAMQLRVVSEALSGLHHAHELCDYDGTPLGVVHRDVSPHNIFVTYSGQVKVVDFGIAKALNSSSETRTGVLKGKVAYMSPEQALGERVDCRADLFSVGVILWQVATGKRMFRGIPDIAVIQKLLAGDIPKVRESVPDIDPRLETIIHKALATKREDRYETAAELQGEIDAFVETLPDRRGCREVGKLVSERFSDERARIQSIIEQQMKGEGEHDLPLLEATFSNDSGPSGRFSSGTPSMSGPTSTTPSRPRTVSEGSGTAASLTVEGQTKVSATHRKGVRVAVIAGAVVALGIGAFVAVSTRGGAATAPTPSAAATSFTLKIDSKPGGAVVKEKDRVLGTTPLSVAVASDAGPRTFMVALDGFEPYEVQPGVLASDLMVTANLTPVAPKASASATQVSASASVSASVSASARTAVLPPPPYVPPVKPPPPPPPATTTTDPGIRTKR
ncbi:MAG: serine/threonine protein kinase [Polyangiaceae bacterium]|nr:serine/threonine protein kinase [Polyangiaceae bacterium]